MSVFDKWKNQNKIKLPDNYVRFLTEVGNGGVGPDYGLYSLETVRAKNQHWLRESDDHIIFDLDKEDKRTVWIEMCRLAEQDDEDHYDEMVDNMLNGALIIGTPGCTMYSVLLCKEIIMEKSVALTLIW